jgi:hypothetical protein
MYMQIENGTIEHKIRLLRQADVTSNKFNGIKWKRARRPKNTEHSICRTSGKKYLKTGTGI